MGYSVDIELRNVKFKKKDSASVKRELKKLNKVWILSDDWCRFGNSLTDVESIICEIGFSTKDDGEYITIDEFEREKLGGHQDMFLVLAPYLEDCEIVYRGEDNCDWKQVVKDGKVNTVYREDL